MPKFNYFCRILQNLRFMILNASILNSKTHNRIKKAKGNEARIIKTVLCWD